MNKVAAVVINRNTKEFLGECLRSLLEQDFDEGLSIWVVDNGSSDGSPQMVLREFLEANLVWNTENHGYARACNQGIRHTVEPYILILNSDTRLSKGTVKEVSDFFDANQKAGIVGPRILNPDGSIQYSCRKFPSIKEAFMHAFLGLVMANNRYSAEYKDMEWSHDSVREVDWVSGAAVGIRRSFVEDVGGFDEGYFMYVEDVDICRRAWDSGWKVYYLPRGDVTHHVAMTTRSTSIRALFYHHASMLRFHLKFYQGPYKRLVNALVALGVTARFALMVGMNGFDRLRKLFGTLTA
ncbi:MAG: glycosyltransferase family 2 protein [Actinomycetota bacterium]|nr:glycosyltransferase family 2 protein [Actinomycetota bacterium]